MIRNFKLVLTFSLLVFCCNTVFSQEVEVVDADSEDVPFSIIEKVPVYPGCKGDDNFTLRNCLNMNFRKHVAKHFNSKVVKKSGLKGAQKIYVKFQITKSGDIKIEGVRGPNKKIEREARRVVKKLPKMIPGKQKGKNVNVTYMLPIIFSVK